MKRPVGVTILALLGFVRGLVGMLGGLTIFGLGFLELLTGFRDVGALRIYLSLALLLISLITFVLSYGLWNVRPWAWMWMVITQVLSLGLEVIPLFIGGALTYVGIVLITLSIVIVAYLLTPGVRKVFLR